MKTKKLLALLLAGAMSASLLAGCGGNTDTAATDDTADTTEQSTETESDLAYVQDKGTLVVGITDFAPMDYRDDNGEWIGFDADMAKAFAEEIGVEAEFIEINWDNKIMELDTKAIDAVWNGMTLTDEVTTTMNCSDPYCVNAQVLVVPSDVADQYQDAASLTDLNIAVESGSAGQAAAEELGLNFTAVQSQANALMEVASGASDACVIDLLMAGAMIGEGTSYPDLTYTVNLNEASGADSEYYGVGFRQDSDLTEAFNEFYAAAYADGTVEELATTYGVQESIVAPAE
ncbi:MAG TPA: transporter substrate-binding domain-containing protein [Candidatus Agathobaculum stercoravium]|nr:transporter substrate-binding domain-containing protein [Candidatus Agathobaculum stercoravium]